MAANVDVSKLLVKDVDYKTRNNIGRSSKGINMISEYRYCIFTFLLFPCMCSGMSKCYWGKTTAMFHLKTMME